MTEELTIITEHVGDLPLLITSMERMGLAELVDQHFVPHGNWQGLSPGQVLTGWLAHILSEADHRLNQVQDWAAGRLETLRGCLDAQVRALDFSDDRLALVLDALSQDGPWSAFEGALNRRTLRVYDLKPRCVRIDTTTASGYWEVTETGLFQRGHSKDGRPDQPQLKVVLSVLDPLGMPLTTQVVAGNRADDPLYIPAVDQVRQGLGQEGLLYVGDCKLMALANRAHLQAGGDYYLAPFSQIQLSPARLEAYLQSVWEGQQPLQQLQRPGADGRLETIAEGFERGASLRVAGDGPSLEWEERRLVVRSLAQARAGEKALHRRLERAQMAIEALNERGQGKTHFQEVADLRQAAHALLRKHQVEGLLQLHYHEQLQERPVRKYGQRPAYLRQERQVRVQVQREEAAIRRAVQRMGWRVYGTNAPGGHLSLEQAVQAYRDQYRVERSFGRLKGRPLSLSPMYLDDDQRATGLVRLLSLGVRVLTLLEGVARQRLARTGEHLTGLYAGNPGRATCRPTTETLLRAFKEVALNLVTLNQKTYRHLSPLSQLQQKILALLEIPVEVYTQLADVSSKPP
jgi:transposase